MSLRLNRAAGYSPFPGPVVMVILDGVGIGAGDESDGVHVAHTPVLDSLRKQSLFTELQAHGKSVGLPSDSDMGNSEVGHNALGAGRFFAQGARLVNEALASGEPFKNLAWSALKQRADKGGTLHFIGLVSDGNVHSHVKQLYALLNQCVQDNISRVRVHALIDGRDVGAKSALDYVAPLEARLEELSSGTRDYRIASGGGRMITTMDRYEADWSIVEYGWKTHVLGQGRPFPTASEAIKTYYREDPAITDQYLESFVITENGMPVGTIEDGDGVVLFNFRGDRAIEISRAFEESEFSAFDRKRVPDVFYAGIMQYDGDAAIPKNYLVAPPKIEGTLSEYLCQAKIPSYSISETQKFGHVTYFWNGNKSGYINESLETYKEIPSDTVVFDQRPWMKAAEITDNVLLQLEEGEAKFIRLNYPNCDMVGHTGNAAATRIAVEVVDLCLGRLVNAVQKAQGIVVVTADHGNADCMWKESDGKRSPMVAHTLNPVPFIVSDYTGFEQFSISDIDSSGLVNVASTVLTLLGLEPPKEFEPSIVTIKGQGLER